MSPARIEILAEGVFAIAMTLLAFDLTVPNIADADVSRLLPGALLDLWPRFVVYAISFVVLGIYWVAHHAQFRVIDAADRPLLWINILLLMFVAFVPFSTSLMGRYPTAQVAVDVYGLVLILIGGAIYLHWSYGTRNHRLIPPEISEGFIRAVKRRILVAPVVCLIAIAISFLSTAAGILLYALLPPFYILPGSIDRHFFGRRSRM